MGFIVFNVYNQVKLKIFYLLFFFYFKADFNYMVNADIRSKNTFKHFNLS